MNLLISFKNKVKLTFLLCCLLTILTLNACGFSGFGAASLRPRGPIYHTVAPGETLSGIAKSYQVDTISVALLNGVYDPDSIYIGQRLYIGSRGQIQHADKDDSSVKSAKGYPSELPDISDQPLKKGSGLLIWPLAGGQIVSQFGPRKSSFHDGIDISARPGTPVLAAHSGLVVHSGQRLSGYGKLIIVRNKSGLTTVYAHNSRLLVEEGDQVTQGEKIAEVGSTGRSSGPHLHFEVRKKDSRNRYVALDPEPLLLNLPNRKPRYRVNESLTPIIAQLGSGK